MSPKLGGLPPATISYIGSRTITGKASSFTFNAVSLGLPAKNRVIAVGLVNSNNNNNGARLASLKIGNVNAIEHIASYGTTDNHGEPHILSAHVPDGDTANVVVTWTSAVDTNDIHIFAVYPSKSLLPMSYAKNSANVNPVSAALPVEVGGVVFAIARMDSSSTATCTWTGATVVGSNSAPWGNSMATEKIKRRYPNYTVTANYAPAGSVRKLLVACWR